MKTLLLTRNDNNIFDVSLVSGKCSTVSSDTLLGKETMTDQRFLKAIFSSTHPFADYYGADLKRFIGSKNSILSALSAILDLNRFYAANLRFSGNAGISQISANVLDNVIYCKVTAPHVSRNFNLTKAGE